jgi:hypothetical protein
MGFPPESWRIPQRSALFIRTPGIPEERVLPDSGRIPRNPGGFLVIPSNVHQEYKNSSELARNPPGCKIIPSGMAGFA